MRKTIVFMLAIVAVGHLSAQKPFKRNTYYAEIGGNSIALAANYERQLANKPGFGVHIGIGFGNRKPTIPLGVKYLFELGKKQRSFFETGAGMTMGAKYLWKAAHGRGTDKNPYEPGFIASVGYRHHTRYGLLWRICYTPIFTSYRNIFYLGGISLGWRL